MNRVMAARPLIRTMVNSNIVPMQQRLYSDYVRKDVGPPASFNQLPHPEGDWKEHHDGKQTKYNGILAGAALAFIGTIAFVKQTGIIYFNASAPDTYE